MMNKAPQILNLQDSSSTINEQKTVIVGKSLAGFLSLYKHVWLTTFCILSMISFTACDDDSSSGGGPVQRGLSPEQMRRLKNAPPTKPKKKAQGAPQDSINKGSDISSVVVIPNRLRRAELLKSSGWDSFKRIRERIKNARDPFWPDIPELKDQDEVEVDPSSVQRKLVVKVPEAVTNLKFKGTLTGMATNLAMLEDSAGTGYSVRVGDIVGKAPEYVRVKMITNNKITFEPVLGVNEDEPKDSPRLIKVLREEEEQRTSELGVDR